MNANFLAIVKRILSEQGESIFAEPQRLKGWISDLAKDEPKPERLAFGRCIEYGAYGELKNAPTESRAAVKNRLAQRLHNEEGQDTALCAGALDILEAAVWGTMSAPEKPVSALLPTYTLSVNMRESGPFSMKQVLAMARNGQITRDDWFRSGDSDEWKPVTDLIEARLLQPKPRVHPPEPTAAKQEGPNVEKTASINPAPQPTQVSPSHPDTSKHKEKLWLVIIFFIPFIGYITGTLIGGPGGGALLGFLISLMSCVIPYAVLSVVLDFHPGWYIGLGIAGSGIGILCPFIFGFVDEGIIIAIFSLAGWVVGFSVGGLVHKKKGSNP
jgi:hypothetical protein